MVTGAFDETGGSAALLDLVIATSDDTAGPDQYRFVATRAWWLGSFGPYLHLTEHLLRQWVPTHRDRDWMLERELTGRQRWLSGSLADARADGFDLHGVAPVGRFRAPFGEFHRQFDRDGTGGDGSRAPRRGSWQSPTPEFLARLPRDASALLARLQADHPGRWSVPFSGAVDALRTCLVPAELRALLYRALTGLPEVRVAAQPADVAGRACLAIVHDAGRTRTELMIDPADGQFAGERDTLRGGSGCDLPAGTPIGETVVRTAVVNALGERP